MVKKGLIKNINDSKGKMFWGQIKECEQSFVSDFLFVESWILFMWYDEPMLFNDIFPKSMEG